MHASCLSLYKSLRYLLYASYEALIYQIGIFLRRMTGKMWLSWRAAQSYDTIPAEGWRNRVIASTYSMKLNSVL
jgi:hypothetical protein